MKKENTTQLKRAFQQALSTPNQWQEVDGLVVLSLSGNVFAVREMLSGKKEYPVFHLYDSEGTSLHEGFIPARGFDSASHPLPDWTISNDGILSAPLRDEHAALAPLTGLSIATGMVISAEEAEELLFPAADADIDTDAVDWFESLPHAGRLRALENDILTAASRLPALQGGPSETEMGSTFEEVSITVGNNWFTSLSESEANDYLAELFRTLPRSVQHAIHTVANNKELMSSEAKDRVYSFRDDTARLYDVTMVGVGKHSCREVMNMIPAGTDVVFYVNSRRLYKHDPDLNIGRFSERLHSSGIPEVHVMHDWDADVYGTAKLISESIEAGKQVVCIYEESSPQYGKTSITLGQELSRRGYDIAWPTCYKDGRVSTVSHERAILRRIGAMAITSGKVHQIDFELDSRGKPTGHFTPREGVSYTVFRPNDPRIRKWNSSRVFSYDGKPHDPIRTDLPQLENMKQMVRRADLVLIVGTNDNSAMLQSARNSAGAKGVFIRIEADPSLLKDPEYARQKMAEAWSHVQANSLWRKAHRELFDASAQKIAVIGAGEKEMFYKQFSLATEQSLYNERLLADRDGAMNGNDREFALSDSVDDLLSQRRTAANRSTDAPEDEVKDAVKPTGVSTDEMETFMYNLFRDFTLNESMESLNASYEAAGLPGPFDQRMLEKEQFNLAHGALQAGIISRTGGSISARLVNPATGKATGTLDFLDLHSLQLLDRETVKARREFNEWKSLNRINTETLHLFAGYSPEEEESRQRSLVSELFDPAIARPLLKGQLDTDIDNLTDADLKALLLQRVGTLPTELRKGVINGLLDASLYDKMPMETVAKVLTGMDLLKDVKLKKDPDANRVVLQSLYRTLTPEVQHSVMNALLLETLPGKGRTKTDCLSETEMRSVVERFQGKRRSASWTPLPYGTTGVNVMKVGDSVLAIQYRQVSATAGQRFVYALYSAEDGSPLHEGVIPGKANDSYLFPSPDWQLENLVETVQEIAERYVHTPLDAGIRQVVSDGNPGLSQAALLAAQRFGVSYLPILAEEVTIATSFRRDGAVLSVPVRAGRDENCRTGLIEGRAGLPTYLQLRPTEWDALVLNPYHLYRASAQDLAVAESQLAKERLAELSAREAPMREGYQAREGEGVRGLTAGQTIAALHMGFSNGQVVLMQREAAEKGITPVGVSGFYEFLNAFNASHGGKLTLNETMVEQQYLLSRSLLTGCAEAGEGVLTASDDNFPAAISASADGSASSLPAALFYKGDLSVLDTPTLAVAGSAFSPSVPAEKAARMAGRRCAQEDVTVVAALRSGTELIAVREALDAGGRVILVSPSALDDEADKELIDEVVLKGGLVISEAMPGSRFQNAYTELINNIMGRDEERDMSPARRDRKVNHITSAIEGGVRVDDRTKRARTLATELGKQILIIETKAPSADNRDASVAPLADLAINGVAVIRYGEKEETWDAYKHEGNEALIAASGADAVLTSGEGMDSVLRRSQHLSPQWVEDHAEQNEQGFLFETVSVGNAPAKVSTVPLEVVRQGCRQVFVTSIKYVQEAVVATYGHDVEFALSRAEALEQLSARPRHVDDADVDTWKGWNGIQLQDDIPYVTKLIYHNDVIYSPTNAPGPAVGDVSETVRQAHYALLHEIIIPGARDIAEELNRANDLTLGKAAFPPLRYQNGLYVAVHEAGVDIYLGSGKEAKEDRLVARVYIDNDGLLRVWNADFDLHLDSVQRARSRVFVMPGIARTAYTSETAGDLVKCIHEAVIESSRDEQKEYALADRERAEEIKQNIETGFRVMDIANTEKTSEGLLASLGATIATPLEGAAKPNPDFIFAIVSSDEKHVSELLTEAKASLQQAVTRSSRLVSEAAAVAKDGDARQVEREDAIEENDKAIATLTDKVGTLRERLAAIRLSKERLAVADDLSVADLHAEKGKAFVRTDNLEEKLDALFRSMDGTQMDTLLFSARICQQKDYTMEFFSSLTLKNRKAIVKELVDAMRNDPSHFFSMALQPYALGKDGKRPAAIPSTAEGLDALFSSLPTTQRRELVLQWGSQLGKSLFETYFATLPLETKAAVIDFIGDNRPDFSQEALKQYDALDRDLFLCVDGRFLAVSGAVHPSNPQLAAAARERKALRETILNDRKALQNDIDVVEKPSRVLSQKELRDIESRRLQRRFDDRQVFNGEIYRFEDKINIGGRFVKAEDGITLPKGVAIAMREERYAYVHAGKIVGEWYKEMTHMPGSRRMLVKTDDDRFNVLNSSGAKILKEDMDEICMDVDRISRIRKGNQWNHVNFMLGGQLVSQDWAAGARDFHEGFAAIQAGMEEEPENRGKWTFINREGDMMTAIWFDEVKDFQNGQATAILNGVEFTLSIDKNGELKEPDYSAAIEEEFGQEQ